MSDKQIEISDAEIVFPSEIINTNDPDGTDMDYCLYHIKEIRYRLSRLGIRFQAEHHKQDFAMALGYLDLAEAMAKSIVDR